MPPIKALLRQLIYHFIAVPAATAALYLMHAADAYGGLFRRHLGGRHLSPCAGFCAARRDRQGDRRLALQVQERLGEALRGDPVSPMRK